MDRGWSVAALMPATNIPRHPACFREGALVGSSQTHEPCRFIEQYLCKLSWALMDTGTLQLIFAQSAKGSNAQIAACRVSKLGCVFLDSHCANRMLNPGYDLEIAGVWRRALQISRLHFACEPDTKHQTLWDDFSASRFSSKARRDQRSRRRCRNAQLWCFCYESTVQKRRREDRRT